MKKCSLTMRAVFLASVVAVSVAVAPVVVVAQTGAQYAIVTSGNGSVVGQLSGDGTSINTLSSGAQGALQTPAAPAPTTPVINAMIAGPTSPSNTVLAANVSCPTQGGCTSVMFQYCLRALNCNFVNFGIGTPSSNNPSLYTAKMTNIPKGVYYWLVVATDSAGTTNSRTASNGNTGIFAVVDPPTAPSITVSTTQPGQGPVPGGIYVGWSGVMNAAGYSVKASTSASGPFNVVQSPVNGYLATVTSLTPNTTYYVEVSALNGAGESPNSAPVSVLTPPAVPTISTQMPGPPTYLGLMWLPTPGATSYLVNLGGVNSTVQAAAANCPPGSPASAMCMYMTGGFPSGTQTACTVAAVNASGGQSPYATAVYCAAQ